MYTDLHLPTRLYHVPLHVALQQLNCNNYTAHSTRICCTNKYRQQHMSERCHVPWTKFGSVYLSLCLAPPSCPPAIHDFNVESFRDTITVSDN